MAIQQLMLGVGGAKKTYVEDIFSTDLWVGDGAAHQVVNGIDISGQGGFVWTKARSVDGYAHLVADTVRGADYGVFPNSSDAQDGSNNNYFSSFNSNGFTTGTWVGANASGASFSGWSFRKTKGFCDVVSYTGNGSNRTIAHSLGSVPGMIMVKRTDSSADWRVYYRGSNGSDTLKLNSGVDVISSPSSWNSTLPTATHFSLGTQTETNANGGTFIAYLFAGGASTAATARSVDFDGSGDYLEISDHADFDLSNSNFTVECWVKGTENANNRNIVGQWSSGNKSWSVFWGAANQSHSAWGFKYSTDNSNETQVSDILLDDDQWHHIAVVRDGDKINLYRDGTWRKSVDVSGVTLYNSADPCRIANDGWDSPLNCHISNVRLVKGTAVYTSSFRVPTEPLSNITNTKLLCCNGTSTTSSTVTPGTITANGDPTSSTVTPFDDPAGFKFGENKEGIIKCGSYVGAGDTDIDVNLGWEPQWILIKNISESSSWLMLDSMRGIVSGGFDTRLYANDADDEAVNSNHIELTPTGFKVKQSTDSGQVVVYMAIRRPDGYVGKPAEAGTDVFATDTGDSSSTIPTFDSGFPVDFAFVKTPDSTSWEWYTGQRLTGRQYMYFNGYAAEGTSSDWNWDSNVGWNTTGSSSYQSWMFKRHAGFDVVATQPGTGSGMVIKHNLGRTPEMIWTKKRATSNWFSNSSEGYVLDNWFVWHKDDDASAAVGYLNSNADGGLNTVYSGSVNSISAQFHSNVTYTNDENVMYFFASVDGICKVGSYTGNGSTTGPSVTTGFQPRLLIVKNAGGTGDWLIYDSLRGFGTVGQNHGKLALNSSAAQTNSSTYFQVSSTGFSVHDDSAVVNTNSSKYIYYAHA